MKTVSTRHDTRVTGSELVEAVVEAGGGIGQRSATEVVNILVVVCGSDHRARFMMGWMAEVAL